MKTDDLIIALARDLRPVRRLPAPGRRAAVWLLATLPVVLVGIALWGPRYDLARAAADWRVQTQALLAVATMTLAALAALALAVPGLGARAIWRGLAVVAAGGWVLLLSGLVAARGGTLAGALAWPLPLCAVKVASIGLVPAALLVAMTRRAAPLDGPWTSGLPATAGLAALAGFAAGGLAVPFICPSNNALHGLLVHVGPVVALGGLAAVAGRWLLGASTERPAPARG